MSGDSMIEVITTKHIRVKVVTEPKDPPLHVSLGKQFYNRVMDVEKLTAEATSHGDYYDEVEIEGETYTPKTGKPRGREQLTYRLEYDDGWMRVGDGERAPAYLTDWLDDTLNIAVERAKALA